MSTRGALGILLLLAAGAAGAACDATAEKSPASYQRAIDRVIQRADFNAWKGNPVFGGHADRQAEIRGRGRILVEGEQR